MTAVTLLVPSFCCWTERVLQQTSDLALLVSSCPQNAFRIHSTRTALNYLASVQAPIVFRHV